MTLIDAAFIGKESSIALAALGPAGSISDSATNLLLFLPIASTNLVASAFSENDNSRIRQIASTSIFLSLIFASGWGTILYKKALWLCGLYCRGTKLLIPYAVPYVQIRAIAIPAAIIQAVGQAICLGTKDAKNPMYSVVFAAAINFLSDFVFCTIFGQGIVGAAWATLISQYCAAILLLFVLARKEFLLFSLDKESIIKNSKKIFVFLPFLFVMLMKMVMHNSAAIAAASLGTTDAAAHTALFAIAMTCFTFGDVGSSTSQAFLPAFNIINKETNSSSFFMRDAMPTVSAILKTTACVSTFVCILATFVILFGAPYITSDLGVVNRMWKTLPIIIATMSMHGMAVTLEGLLLAQVTDFIQHNKSL